MDPRRLEALISLWANKSRELYYLYMVKSAKPEQLLRDLSELKTVQSFLDFNFNTATVKDWAKVVTNIFLTTSRVHTNFR